MNGESGKRDAVFIEDTRIYLKKNGTWATPRSIDQYTYSNPIIIKQGCLITALLMHPYLNKAAFASLESVAAFVFPKERTCLLIQTSMCKYKLDANVTSDIAYQHLIKQINEEAGPLLKGMIQMGNVRLTILDHTKYHLQRCDVFDPISTWLNYYYWDDYEKVSMVNGAEVYQGEFVPGQDSDLVLIVQTDTTLCTGLDVRAWSEFSYVGAPWEIERMVITMIQYWWILHSSPVLRDGAAIIPPFPSDLDFQSDPKVGPIGNGGLSLRSRYWMQQVIDYCPHPTLSNLLNISTTRTCFADTKYEDVYFSTILRGLAYNMHNLSFTWKRLSNDKKPPLKLPTMLEAAYFSVEARLLRDFVKHYQTSDEEVDAMIEKLSWWDGKYQNVISVSTSKVSKIEDQQVVEDGRLRFKRLKTLETESDGGKPIVSIGSHKLWYSLSHVREHFMNECPYLKDIWPI